MTSRPIAFLVTLLVAALSLAAPDRAPARPLNPAEQKQADNAQASLQAAMARRDWAAAAIALRTTLTLNRGALGPDDPNTLATLETLAIAEQLGGDHARSLATYRQAEAARLARREGETAAFAAIQAGIGINLDRLGKYPEAEIALRRALAIRLKTNGADSREVGFVRSELGKTLVNGGKLPEAREMFAASLDAARRIDGPGSDSVAAALGNLASVEGNLGNFERAEQILGESLALQRKNSGPDSLQLSIALNNLATLKVQRGDLTGAERVMREAVGIQRRAAGDASPITARGIANLASVVQNAGRPAEALPLYREAIGAFMRAFGSDHPDTIKLESNYATALSDLGRDQEAEAIVRRVYARRLADLGPAHPETVIAINNLAAVTEKLGREQEAETLYRQSISAARGQGGENAALATTISNLATNIGEQGRFSEAESLHRQALAMRERLLGADHPDVALSLSNLGFVLTQQRRFEEANAPLARAVAIGRKVGLPTLALSTQLNNWGGNLDELERYGEAATAYREAYQIRRTALGVDHPLVAIALGNLGYNAAITGNSPLAITHYRAALGIFRKSTRPDNPDLIPSLGNLAIQLAEKRGGHAEALKLGREAADIARKRRALLLAGGTGDAAQRALARARGDSALGADPYVTAFIALAEINWKVAQGGGSAPDMLRDEAFVAAQEVDLSKASQAMARTAARTAAGGGELGTLVGRQQALSASLSALETSYLAATIREDGAEAQRIDEQLRRSSGELSRIDDEIEHQFPAYRALIAPTPLGATDVASRLGPDEGLIFIVPLNGSMYSFAAGPGGRRWSRLDKGQKPVSAKVAKLLCQLDPVTCAEARIDDKTPLSTAERDGFSAFDRATAHSLYADLVKPVEPALAGAKRVFVVNIGKFGALPLGLLPTAPPAAGSDDADPAILGATPWLADRYMFVTLPSVASLRFADSSRPAASRSFVGYGAPSLGAKGVSASRALRGASLFRSGQGNIANQTVLKQLSPLPGAETELKAMAIALGEGAGTLRLGGSATETALKSDPRLGSARVIAFATHGLLPGELAGYDEPGLVFTPPVQPGAADDGVLAASEAATLRLNADWVILSACNTAAGENGAEGLSGLARAFLFAGARSLLASHWRVSDDATAALTVEALLADRTMTRGEALAAAMRAVRTGKRADGSALQGWRPEWAHPSAWAPFSLIANSDR